MNYNGIQVGKRKDRKEETSKQFYPGLTIQSTGAKVEIQYK